MFAAIVLFVAGFLVGAGASKLRRLLFFSRFSALRVRQLGYLPARRPMRYRARKFQRSLHFRGRANYRFWRAFDRLDLTRRYNDESTFTR